MEKKKLALANFPGSKARFKIVSDLIEILEPISDGLYVITSKEFKEAFSNDNCELIGISHKKGKNPISRVIKFIFTQIKIAKCLTKNKQDFDTVIFGFGGFNLIIPVFLLKLYNKEVIIRMSIELGRSRSDFFSKILDKMAYINMLVADKILEKSNRNKSKNTNLPFFSKIHVVEDHVIETNKFKKKKSYAERENKIGYIGRFAEVKGIRNLVSGILLVDFNEELNFILGGDGKLKDQILSTIENENRIEYLGWIDHSNLPNRLNELKLLVIPSHSETGPRIALEAMACGTPVLGTKVGILPELINEGENGFLLKNNEPETIADRIKEILQRDDLETISENARKSVIGKYTEEKIRERYKEIIYDL